MNQLEDNICTRLSTQHELPSAGQQLQDLLLDQNRLRELPDEVRCLARINLLQSVAIHLGLERSASYHI